MVVSNTLLRKQSTSQSVSPCPFFWWLVAESAVSIWFSSPGSLLALTYIYVIYLPFMLNVDLWCNKIYYHLWLFSLFVTNPTRCVDREVLYNKVICFVCWLVWILTKWVCTTFRLMFSFLKWTKIIISYLNNNNNWEVAPFISKFDLMSQSLLADYFEKLTRSNHRLQMLTLHWFNPFTTEARFWVLNAIAFST